MDSGRNIAQKAVNKTILKKKKSKKSKWLSEEALQIDEEKREAKSKGERDRYFQLNAEFQRTVRRDKKAFFSEWCIKLKENSRRGKTRDHFRKIDIEGTFNLPESSPCGSREFEAGTASAKIRKQLLS